MSDDEIRFDDIAYREPHKLKRLDLDRRVVSIPYQIPSPDDLLIFLDRKPGDLIERHALRDTSVELGGILLGKECLDEETGRTFVWVTEALEAKHYENTQASFTYTHDSWEEITRERDSKHPDLDIVGWYHTHPDFGIFLSSHDLFIHHNFFAQPLQVAYVVDPIRQTRGFFQWRDGQMAQVGGFFLTASRAERLQVARLVNELEGIPNADGGGGGGGGLSPRLEAELFAMLSRPQTVAVAADRGQSAAVFTLLGALVASIIFAGGLWLQTLGRNMTEQTKVIEDLVKAQKEAAATSAKSIDGERSAAQVEALQTVFKEVKGDPATAPARIVARLSEVIAERDASRRDLNRIKIEKEAISDRATTNEERARTAQGKYEDIRKELAERERLDKEELEQAKEQSLAYKTKLEDAERLLKDSATGRVLEAIQLGVLPRDCWLGGFSRVRRRACHGLFPSSGRQRRIAARASTSYDHMRRMRIASIVVLVFSCSAALTFAGVPEPAPPVPVPEPSELALQFYRSGVYLWLLNQAWMLLIPAIAVFSGLSAKLRDLSWKIGRRWFFAVAVFAAICVILEFLVSLPLDYYEGFVRLHQYSLAPKSYTVSVWFVDALKRAGISVVLTASGLWIPYWLLDRSPRRWWIYTAILAVPVSFFLMFITPILVDPLFNRYGPMQDVALEAKIRDLATRAGIDGGRIFEVDKSKETAAVTPM